MKRRISIGAVLALVVLTGCSGELPTTSPPDQPRRIQAEFAAMTPERVMRQSGIKREWRDAVRLDAGKEYRFEVGMIDADAVLRLGLSEGKSGAYPITVTVLVGEEPAQTFQSDSSGFWQDWTLPLKANAVDAVPCSITVRSPAKFWMSTLELVQEITNVPNVVIVLIDTLRQDHLGCYGYIRETSPHIDRLSKDSVRFTQLVPASSWTRPSVASLLTSTYPNVHGAQDRGDRVRTGLPWLAESLANSGYETHAVMTNPHCIPLWGIGDDFFRFVDMGTKNWVKLDDKIAAKKAITTLRSFGGRPFFLYLHLFAPHEPYDPPLEFAERFLTNHDGNGDIPEQVLVNRDLYDAEIAYSDQLLGQFFDEMKALKLFDSSLIVLLSDHGEEFWDHGGTGHGKTLYEEQLRVPLLIKLPGNHHAGETITSIVEMVDIAPTILELVGVEPEARHQGKSLVDVIEQRETEERIGYASLQMDELSMRATKTPSLKYIHDVVTKSESWYDLELDPGELMPIREVTQPHETLRAHASAMGALGAKGFHMLITHDSSRPLTVTGSITAPGLENAQLRYPENLSTIVVQDESVQFSVNMPYVKDATQASAQWRETLKLESELVVALLKMSPPRTEQDHAELTVILPATAEIEINIQIDGESIPPSSVYLGEAGTHSNLNGTRHTLSNLIALPDTYDPAGLPQRTAVYVWFVPDVERISDDELDPALLESMRALGYID